MKTVQPGSKAYLRSRGSCSFAGLGYFMKLCYADPQLKVSKEEFERPENLSKKWIVTLLQKQKLRPFKIQMNSILKDLEAISRYTL
jgi:hypothetical protein